MSDAAIAELAPKIGVRNACDAVGVAQAGYYRRHRSSPPPARSVPLPHKDRPQPPQPPKLRTETWINRPDDTEEATQ